MGAPFLSARLGGLSGWVALLMDVGGRRAVGGGGTIRMSFLLASCVEPSMAAFRFSSRLSSRVGVLCCRASRVSVYPVAPFLSVRVPVLSRLFSSLLLFYSCSSRRACRMASGR